MQSLSTNIHVGNQPAYKHCPNHPITQSPNHPITQSPNHPIPWTPEAFLDLIVGSLDKTVIKVQIGHLPAVLVVMAVSFLLCFM